MHQIPGLQNLCIQRDWRLTLSMKRNVRETFLFKTNQHLRLFSEAPFNNCAKTLCLKILLSYLECPFF